MGDFAERFGLKILSRSTSHIQTTLGRFNRSDFLGEHLPTPAEIAAACEKFQAGWTDKERYRRRKGKAD